MKCVWFGRRWARDEQGQDLIEYAVLAAFVSLIAVIGALALNSAVGSLYTSTSGRLNHGANFTTQGSVSVGGADCVKDKDTSASAGSACK